MRGLSFILLTGILLMLGSCFYNDSEIYFVDPVPGDPPDFSVTTSLDTLVDPEINDSLEVSYDVTIENGAFYLMEAYLDGSWLFNSDSIRDSFWVQYDDVSYPGVDTLFLFFYYSTNTNSLADLINLEANVVRKTYGIQFNEGAGP
ncbi:MAG: hypothetical protein ACWGNV_04635 [Bacteroidales bacterium]